MFKHSNTHLKQYFTLRQILARTTVQCTCVFYVNKQIIVQTKIGVQQARMYDRCTHLPLLGCGSRTSHNIGCGEPTASYRRTDWAWELAGRSSRLQNYSIILGESREYTLNLIKTNWKDHTMQPVGPGNTKILTDYSQQSLRTLIESQSPSLSYPLIYAKEVRFYS